MYELQCLCRSALTAWYVTQTKHEKRTVLMLLSTFSRRYSSSRSVFYAAMNPHVQPQRSGLNRLYPQYRFFFEGREGHLVMVAQKCPKNRTSNYHVFDMQRGGFRAVRRLVMITILDSMFAAYETRTKLNRSLKYSVTMQKRLPSLCILVRCQTEPLIEPHRQLAVRC